MFLMNTLIRRLMMLTNKADGRSSDSGRYRNDKSCHKTSSFFYLTEETPGSFITGRFYPYFKPLTSGMRQSRRTMPMIPTRMPGIIMFQTITIHMPMANRIPPMVPRIKDTKFFFCTTDNLHFFVVSIVNLACF